MNKYFTLLWCILIFCVVALTASVIYDSVDHLPRPPRPTGDYRRAITSSSGAITPVFSTITPSGGAITPVFSDYVCFSAQQNSCAVELKISAPMHVTIAPNISMDMAAKAFWNAVAQAVGQKEPFQEK